MNDGNVKPISDDEFKRAQRIADRKAERELRKKMRDRPLEQIIDEFAGKVEPDPAAPLGKCERCGAAYEASETGRLKDHVCASILASVASQHVTPAERAAERSVNRVVLGIRRTRRDRGEEE